MAKTAKKQPAGAAPDTIPAAGPAPARTRVAEKAGAGKVAKKVGAGKVAKKIGAGKVAKKVGAGKVAKKAGVGKVAGKPGTEKAAKNLAVGKFPKKLGAGKAAKKAARMKRAALALPPAPPLAVGASSAVLDRLWNVVNDRRDADPAISHSARLLSRGTAKVAQKFGEEAVECVIEAVGGNRAGLVAESADVLYHLIVMWVNGGVRPDEVWAELQRREGVSGVAEKASRARALPLEMGVRTTKIP